MRSGRVIAVVAKEGREVIRDPITVAVAILMPLIMLFLFGYAISLDIDQVRMGVLDHDRSAASRNVVSRFSDSHYFQLVQTYETPDEAEAALQAGEVRLVLVFPPNFQSTVTSGRSTQIQVLVDGTYSATANLVASYAQTIINSYHDPRPAPVQVMARVWYNPALPSVTYVVPGLFGVILMAFPPLLTALAITREKETGSIQQIFASPLTASEFLLGKLVPYGLIAFLQIIIVIVVGFVWFDLPLRGSLGLLVAVGLVYVFCTVGIGLLVSTFTNNQLTSMLVALIVTLMPSFLFSGFLFPIFTMPYALQLYTRIFPTQYFVDFSRGIVLKGAGLPELWPSVVLLLAYTLIVFAIAAFRFKKKVA